MRDSRAEGDETVESGLPLVVDRRSEQGAVQGGDSGQWISISLSSYFRDPEGSTLSFSASTSNAAVADVAVSGDVVTITHAGTGTAIVNAVARDPGGLSVQQGIAVAGGSDQVTPAPPQPKFRAWNNEQISVAVEGYVGLWLAEETVTYYAGSIAGSIAVDGDLSLHASGGVLGISATIFGETITEQIGVVALGGDRRVLRQDNRPAG